MPNKFISGAQPMLALPDVWLAANWYCTVLGFELIGTWGDPTTYAVVQLGQTRINFIASAAATGETGKQELSA